MRMCFLERNSKLFQFNGYQDLALAEEKANDMISSLQLRTPKQQTALMDYFKFWYNQNSKLLTNDKQEDTFGPKILFIDKNNNVAPPGREGGKANS